MPPDEAAMWFEYWCGARMDWYTRAGHPRRQAPAAAPRRRRAEPTTRPAPADVEYLFPWGWGELEGIANRTDYDLTQHAEHSGVDLDYYGPAGRRALPPPRDRAGRGGTRTDDGVPAGRLRYRGGAGGTRTVLRLHPRLAPYKAAVLPLSRNPSSRRCPKRCWACSSPAG